jgi:hypothetical protein
MDAMGSGDSISACAETKFGMSEDRAPGYLSSYGGVLGTKIIS